VVCSDSVASETLSLVFIVSKDHVGETVDDNSQNSDHSLVKAVAHMQLILINTHNHLTNGEVALLGIAIFQNYSMGLRVNKFF